MDNIHSVLVTGATGAVGPAVVQALHQAGYRIRVFSLDAPAAGGFPRDVEVLIGDVTEQAAVRSAMRGVDAVVHMAALLHIVDPSPEWRGRYEQVNVGGTATAVKAAIQEGVKRVVLFSTIAVYGQANKQVFNELSPTNPDTSYARTKLAAEKIVLEARRADGQPLGTVLRLGAVYGSCVKGNYERLTRALAHRRFIPIGNGLNRRTLIYDKDVGRAAVLAVSHPAAAGGIFNVTDGGLHALKDIIASICSALGHQPPRFSLPTGPTRALAGLVEKGYRSIGIKPPITREMIDKYTDAMAVEGGRIQKELGFMPRYDLKAGWKETIEEMRVRGEL